MSIYSNNYKIPAILPAILPALLPAFKKIEAISFLNRYFSLINNAKSEYECVVYTWETIFDDRGNKSSVGHSSLELKGITYESGKKIDSSKKYLSFRPKHSWMVNPLTLFLPVKGKNVPSLQEDMSIEGSPHRTVTKKISEKEFKALSNNIDETTTQIKNNEYLYQLFPGLSLLHVIKKLATDVAIKAFSACPFSGLNVMGDHQFNFFSNTKEIVSAHCSLAVAKVLSTIERIPINPYLPWKITPTELGNIVDILIAV
jgi:hypothetical protein